MSRKDFCHNCRAWKKMGDSKSGGSYGQCRSASPTTRNFEGGYDGWPLTNDGDWCLEHVTSGGDKQERKAKPIAQQRTIDLNDEVPF